MDALRKSLEYVACSFDLDRVKRSDLVKWADGKIDRIANYPDWLLDISLECPDNYFDLRRKIDFLPGKYPFAFCYDIWASSLKPPDKLLFAKWLSWSCLGEELSHPGVQAGYNIDDRIYDPKEFDLIVIEIDELLQENPGHPEMFKSEFPWLG